MAILKMSRRRRMSWEAWYEHTSSIFLSDVQKSDIMTLCYRVMQIYFHHGLETAQSTEQFYFSATVSFFAQARTEQRKTIHKINQKIGASICN